MPGLGAGGVCAPDCILAPCGAEYDGGFGGAEGGFGGAKGDFAGDTFECAAPVNAALALSTAACTPPSSAMLHLWSLI
jgi:hypothetical protein